MKKSPWVLEVAAGLGMASLIFVAFHIAMEWASQNQRFFRSLLSNTFKTWNSAQLQITPGSCVECLSEILRVFGPIPPPLSAASRARSVAGVWWQMYFEVCSLLGSTGMYWLMMIGVGIHSTELIDLVLGAYRCASEQHQHLPLRDSHSLFIQESGWTLPGHIIYGHPVLDGFPILLMAGYLLLVIVSPIPCSQYFSIILMFNSHILMLTLSYTWCFNRVRCLLTFRPLTRQVRDVFFCPPWAMAPCCPPSGPTSWHALMTLLCTTSFFSWGSVRFLKNTISKNLADSGWGSQGMIWGQE